MQPAHARARKQRGSWIWLRGTSGDLLAEAGRCPAKIIGSPVQRMTVIRGFAVFGVAGFLSFATGHDERCH